MKTGARELALRPPGQPAPKGGKASPHGNHEVEGQRETETSPLRGVFSFEGAEALIERVKYGFGTTGSGGRVHILYSLAPKAYTALCRGYTHEGQADESLTIQDVDCKRCRKTLTYSRLLPKGRFKKSATRHSAPMGSGNAPGTARPGTRTPVPPEPEHDGTGFTVKPVARPKLMFDSEEEVRCVFLTLVARADRLREKYKEGIAKFLERHGARCNRKLVYLCSMGWEDLEGPARDLERNGLTFGEDCICFDAAGQLLGFAMAGKFEKKASREMKFPVEWLRGRIDKGGVLVSFVEKTREARKQ